MTAVIRQAAPLFDPRLAPLGVGMVGLAGWLVALGLAPAGALQGWLIAFVTVSGPILGALALVLIERLTGGRWGEAFAPELEPAARTQPLLLLFALPVALGLPLIFPWAGNPASVDASVRGGWLNPAAYIARTLALLLGWSLIAWRLPSIEGPRGRLGAGLALAFHGLAASFVAVDWVLSIRPSFTDSAAGMTLVSAQLAAGLAYAAMQGRARAARSATGDLGGLLFATLLGLTYLSFMSFLVGWYGDRPETGGWWIPRASLGWGSVAVAALAVGFVVPAALMALRRRIGARRAVMLAGASATAGLVLFHLWRMAPTFGPACVLPAACALLAQGGLWLAAVGGAPRWAEAWHGR